MKKLLLIATLIFSTSMARGQTWCLPGAQWHWGYNGFVETGFVELTLVSDTVIAGIACHKLLVHAKHVNQQFGNVTETYSSVFTYEDNGVVFVYGSNGWEIVYNFNANPNDTWLLFQGDIDDYVQVEDTGHSIIQGFNLRWLTVTYHPDFSGFPGPDTIYERIGCTGYNYPFMTSVLSTDPHISGFCNYSDNAFNDWPNPDILCTLLPDGISEQNMTPAISLFPNPASFEINIKANSERTFHYRIYNLFGQLIKTGLGHSNLTSVSIDQLTAGFYNIELTTDNKTQRLYFIVDR